MFLIYQFNQNYEPLRLWILYDPKRYCIFNEEAKELLKMAMTELGLSARAYDKILKTSRTIADLAGSQDIKTEHISEAVQYSTETWIDSDSNYFFLSYIFILFFLYDSRSFINSGFTLNPISIAIL